MKDNQKLIVDLEIFQPGRPTGQYRPIDYETLKLERVVVPIEMLDFDLAILPKTMTPYGEPLKALLLSQVSHPSRTLVPARIIGGFSNNGSGVCLVAVAEGDAAFSEAKSIQDVPQEMRTQIEDSMSSLHAEGIAITWHSTDEIPPYVRQAYIQYRKAQAAAEQSGSIPAWKPAETGRRIVDCNEATHYTDAEFTFYQLPGHFQHYVGDYLAPDERILYAMRRPAMYSHRQRSWLSRTRLQEGVLILTNRRLLHLVELTPPGDSGVRYGYHAQMGVLERLNSYVLSPAGEEAVVLITKWEARKGVHSLEWEFPVFNQVYLNELLGYLERFLPQKCGPRALRRSSPPPAPEVLPRLIDPTANEPGVSSAIHDRFVSRLSYCLKADEQLQAWALWPDWFENRRCAEVLLVTNRNLEIVPDEDPPTFPRLTIPLADIAGIEYVSSILKSSLKLYWWDGDKLSETHLPFPYTTEDAFRSCLNAIWRCMAVLPLV